MRMILGWMLIVSFMTTPQRSLGSIIDASRWINEFHYDNAGSDRDEFIEVVARLSEPLDLTLTLYNGSGGTAYASYSMTDFTLGETRNGFGIFLLRLPRNGIQNGPDGLALSETGGNLLQFLSYEGSFMANDGPAWGTTSTDIGVAETSSTSIGASLQLRGAGDTFLDFHSGPGWAGPLPASPGSVNSGQSLGRATRVPPVPEPAGLTIWLLLASVVVALRLSRSRRAETG